MKLLEVTDSYSTKALFRPRLLALWQRSEFGFNFTSLFFLS